MDAGLAHRVEALEALEVVLTLLPTVTQSQS